MSDTTTALAVRRPTQIVSGYPMGVNLDAACWLWTHSTINGYGQMWVGNSHKDGVKWLAHRYMWTVMRGPIPEGMEIHHLCRNRSCVNPLHMELLPHAEHSALANGSKTHCPKGHPYSGSNLYVKPGSGARECRTCIRERSR